MNYRPRCPTCRTKGQHSGPYRLMTLTAADAEERGLDPVRTSRIAFDCRSCDAIFPALAYQPGSATPEINVLDLQSKPWGDAVTWFAPIKPRQTQQAGAS